MSYKENYFRYSLQYVFDNDTQEWVPQESSGGSPTVVVQDNSAYGGLQRDAWGKQKVTYDYSLFHGIFTYTVRDSIWEEYSLAGSTWTPLTTTGTRATSANGALSLKSGTVAGNGAVLRSKRSPRYQPNRGHLVSTACILPNPTGDGRRKWGLFSKENGVYFELEGDGSSWKMYAVRKSDGVVELREDITSLLPTGFDPSKGHVYDIQFQWRGVGNYTWYINLQEVYKEDALGTRTSVSMRNPALPAAYECSTDTSTELELLAGCVDITSEGGVQEGRTFLSVSTGGEVQIDKDGRAVIGIRLPRTVTTDDSATVENMKNVVATKIANWCRDESGVQAYIARDTVATNLNALGGWSSVDDSNVEYLIGGETTALDNAFQLDRSSMRLLLEEWIDIEEKNVIENPAAEDAPYYLTPGDILIVAVESFAGNKDTITTLYLAEEL
jgi:hypothetical protein